MSDEKAQAHPAGAASGKPHGVHAEQRKAHRFRVNWHADVVFADQSVHQGFINDISTQGTAIFLSDSQTSEDATLYIHIPPLSLAAKPQVVAVSGKMVYVVFDSDKQMYRIAFVFQKFQHAADQAYLEERLSKYQTEIHEPESRSHLVEL